MQSLGAGGQLLHYNSSGKLVERYLGTFGGNTAAQAVAMPPVTAVAGMVQGVTDR